MHDIECPYCEAGQEIDHDEGYGYAEDCRHEQQCKSCGKTFTYTTSISYHYEPAKADCLNGNEHLWVLPKTWPRSATRWKCKDCDATKPLTEAEKDEHGMRDV
jgi:transposase-like protein